MPYTLSVVVDDDLHRATVAASAHHRLTISAFVRMTLTNQEFIRMNLAANGVNSVSHCNSKKVKTSPQSTIREEQTSDYKKPPLPEGWRDLTHRLQEEYRQLGYELFYCGDDHSEKPLLLRNFNYSYKGHTFSACVPADLTDVHAKIERHQQQLKEGC